MPHAGINDLLGERLGHGGGVYLCADLFKRCHIALRNVIPSAVRIPCYIVVIAPSLQVVDLLMQLHTPALADSLGIFIPLIVVNCIILGRAEAYASKNGVLYSMADGLGMGLGFTLSLSIIAIVREFFGNGSITLWGDWALTNIHHNTMVLVILPAGGFITLGLILALMNHMQAVAARRAGAPAPLPLELNCRSCALCKLNE